MYLSIQQISEVTKLSYRSRFVVRLTAIGCSASLWLSMGWISATLAQPTTDPLTPEICTVDLSLLKSKHRSSDPNIVTVNTVSAKGTTTPSLWWTSEQFSPKLGIDWIANRAQKQIYLIVNTQYWNNLDYIDRYRTIDRFGRVAQSDGYNLQVCNTQKIAIARYTCDANPLTANHPSPPAMTPVATSESSCQIWVNTIGQNGLGVQTK